MSPQEFLNFDIGKLRLWWSHRSNFLKVPSPSPGPTLRCCRVMTAKEWDSLPGGLLDQGVADNSRSVCSPALLHCM